jgi:hypothetical protein
MISKPEILPGVPLFALLDDADFDRNSPERIAQS